MKQFPVQAADELYKQMIPDLNGFLRTPNPTWTNMAALGVQLHGAVLIGHSESGFFPEEAAMINPVGAKGIVSIEMGCTTTLKPEQLATLSKIPILIMFGDHLGDIPGPFSSLWPNKSRDVQYVREASERRGRRREEDYPSRRWASRETATC